MRNILSNVTVLCAHVYVCLSAWIFVCVYVCFEVNVSVLLMASSVCVCVCRLVSSDVRTRRGVSEVIWPRWSHTARCHSLRISRTLRDPTQPGGARPLPHTHTHAHALMPLVRLTFSFPHTQTTHTRTHTQEFCCSYTSPPASPSTSSNRFN